MALKFTADVRNAMLDAIETAVGTGPVLKIRSGSEPASTGDADSGSVLATITLPSDWMAAASSGVKNKTGTWEDSSADATGTAGHFRIYASDGSTVKMQGAVTNTAGAGPLKINNTSITEGQPVTVVQFTLTAGNAG